MPNLVDRIKLFTKSSPIFEEFNIEKQIEEALSNKVWLKSGGYIVIDETEALVTIDVNTGRFIGGPSLEDTIYKINMETIPEIVRQIRLRDLGGIIIIDFIDMTDEDNKMELIKNLEEEFRKDRMRCRISSGPEPLQRISNSNPSIHCVSVVYGLTIRRTPVTSIPSGSSGCNQALISDGSTDCRRVISAYSASLGRPTCTGGLYENFGCG